MGANIYSKYKILGTPEKMAAMLEGRLTPPIYVRVKPINRCSHACSWCAYSDGTKRKGDKADHFQTGMHTDMEEADMLPTAKLFEIIHDFDKMGVKAMTFSGGGEPLLHPNIKEAIDMLIALKIKVSIITNGQSLTGGKAVALSKASWVRVSIDYTNAQQMNASRNIKEAMFDKIMGNMRDFAQIKDEGCKLEVNYIVHRGCYENLMPFTQELVALGVENVRFSPMWVPNLKEYHAPIVDDVRAQLRLMEKAGLPVNSTWDLDDSAHHPIRTYSRCFVQEFNPVIGANQNAYRCHNTAFSKAGLIGSIKDRSFYDLWNDPETYRNMREFDCRVCKFQCSSDAKNKLLNDIADTSFDSFI